MGTEKCGECGMVERWICENGMINDNLGIHN
jgi:hypothetical protein